jgi:hypothetical protein
MRFSFGDSVHRREKKENIEKKIGCSRPFCKRALTS